MHVHVHVHAHVYVCVTLHVYECACGMEKRIVFPAVMLIAQLLAKYPQNARMGVLAEAFIKAWAGLTLLFLWHGLGLP